jgi:hypothetical protein
MLRLTSPIARRLPNRWPKSGADVIPQVSGGIHFCVCPCLHAMFNSTRRQSQHMKKRGFQRGNEQSAAAHAARWGERVVSDAGAPAPAPRAPYPPQSGALIAPPTTQVQSNRPLQLLPLLRTAQPQQSDKRSVQSLLRRHHLLQLQSTLVPTRRQRAVSAAVVAPR